MARYGVRQLRAIATVCAMTAAAICVVSHRADAFDLKHTSHGQILRWAKSQVSYVVDASVEKAVPGGADAVSSAVGGWSGAAGGPELSSTVGGGARPGLDGQNSVLLAPEGFAPAGSALAVTVTSYDAATGNIVDSDIVINGLYRFAVLAAHARPASGAARLSTDGSSSNENEAARGTPFDLVHVVAHEVGHTLGLADEKADDSALMYAFTMPGDASSRVPSKDDVDGVEAIYGASVAAKASPGHSGCGQASVAESRTRSEDVWGASALVAGAGVWLAWRRRARGVARVVLPVCGALVALVVGPAPVRSAPRPLGLLADAAARVVDVSTSNVGGLFETTMELAPMACRKEPCPARAWAHAWGGTLAGITQRVGGELVPGVGDLVDVTFFPSAKKGANARPVAVVMQAH